MWRGLVFSLNEKIQLLKELYSISANEKYNKELNKITLNLMEIREYLIEKAKLRKFVSYKEFRDDFKLEYTIQTFNPLKQISKDCIERNEPLLSALVVNETGLPGKGFFDKKTKLYLRYNGPAIGPEAKKIHQREVEKILNWKWS